MSFLFAEGEAQFNYARFYFSSTFFEVLLIGVYEDKIVHIPNIAFDVELLFNVMVEVIENCQFD